MSEEDNSPSSSSEEESDADDDEDEESSSSSSSSSCSEEGSDEDEEEGEEDDDGPFRLSPEMRNMGFNFRTNFPPFENFVSTEGTVKNVREIGNYNNIHKLIYRAFMKFFEKFSRHVCFKTNQEFQKKDMNYKIIVNDIIHHYVINFGMGVVRIQLKKKYFKNNKILDNGKISKFASLMSYDKYRKIDNNIQCDLFFVQKDFHIVSNHFFKVSTMLSADDDMDKWKGRGGQKKHNKKKADGQGPVAWKVVGKSRYCSVYFYEDDDLVLREQRGNELKGSLYLRTMCAYMDKWQGRSQRLWIIDAGTLGTVKNAIFASNRGDKFLLSCAKNRPSWMWKYVHKNLEYLSWNFVRNANFGVLSYWCRGQTLGKKKVINFAFNFRFENQSLTLNDPRLIYSKRERRRVSAPTPKVRNVYSLHHNYVDARRSIFSRARNVHKNKKYWRVKLSGYANAKNVNCFLFVKTLWNSGDMKLGDFIEALVCIFSEKISPKMIRNPFPCSVIMHDLEQSGKVLRCQAPCFRSSKKCSANTRWKCSRCEVALCRNDMCSLIFHNPNLQIRTN